ncbi:MAG: hypothetical protein WKF63_10220, partial [Thermomicrobiales bacterium]
MPGLDIIPLARGKRPKRRRWYRRKPVLIPVVLLVLMGAAIVGAIVSIDGRLDIINALGTPPPVGTGARLGGDEGITIDTGPAQVAVRQAQFGETTSTSTVTSDSTAENSGVNALVFTESGGVLMAFQPQGQATPPLATPELLPATAESATPATIQLPPSDTRESINVLLMGVDARPGEAID